MATINETVWESKGSAPGGAGAPEDFEEPEPLLGADLEPDFEPDLADGLSSSSKKKS
jgi:hypothetical protein